MFLPKLWGEGQLFAFSAFDGENSASDDFSGMLLKDRLGIRFYTKTRRELVLADSVPSEFIAVCSDYIEADGYLILFAAKNLVVGRVPAGAEPKISIENSQDGDFTTLLCREGRFSLSYAHNAEEALDIAIEGLSLDLEAVTRRKRACYHISPSELAAKCLSVMKTQVYFPEESFRGFWSTPDRLPHHHLWLWDSVFHAIGFRNINGALAESLILSVFDHQREDGFIPHMADVGLVSEITQPPVLAWGAWLVYEKTGNKEFLREVYEKNGLFLAWCRKNRRLSDKELYTWNTGNDENCRCDESGMDNSPRFDAPGRLFAIDYSCFMANEARYMSCIAEELELESEIVRFAAWYEVIRADINKALWSEEDGFYFDQFVSDGTLSKVWSVASFLPLFSGLCPMKRAEALVEKLENPELFGTPVPIPSIAKRDLSFGTDMWRGPVWINYNYMITSGLLDYGFEDLAREIREKTIAAQKLWYEKTGTIFEFYDCMNEKAPSLLNRKGTPVEPYNIDVRYQAIRDYGWSTTLLFDWLINS